MKIGTVRELKDNEYRVGLVPGGVKSVVEGGHEVFVEDSSGLGSGVTNAQYEAAGARVLPSANDVFETADMIVKVKEPVSEEVTRLRDGQILFTYLHLAPLPDLTKGLLERNVTSIAYETITASDGSLPLLTPMSEVAGRMSILEGAHYLEKAEGGLGMLLSGVPGVPRGDVVVIGGGVVGLNAAKIATGIGARVTVIDKSLARMQYLDDIFEGRITTLMSNSLNILEMVRRADLLIGAVLIPGAAAPHVVKREMVKAMKPGSVIVDVSVDQGGCIETTRPTTHSDPTYVEEGVPALLRDEHAGCGTAHVDLRAHQRDPPLRARDRQPGVRRCGALGCQSACGGPTPTKES